MDGKAGSAAAKAARPVHTLCGVLHTNGCRVSEALALTPERVDLAGRLCSTPHEAPPGRLQGGAGAARPSGQLDLVHGLREAQRRGKGHADRPLWPLSRMTAWRQVKAVMAAAGIPAGRTAPQGPAAGDYVRQNGLRPSCQASAELRPMSLSA